MFEKELNTLAKSLEKIAPNKQLAIAYSGGVDSRFLSHASTLLGYEALLIHVTGPHIPPAETALAKSWAKKHSLNLIELSANPLLEPNVVENSRERCYFCKHVLFTLLFETVRNDPDFATAPLCDGTNTSDSLGWRPGKKALKELGVYSPLADAGLDKPTIRRLAAKTGMEEPGQKARPCMLTRLAYGMHPTADLLERLAKAEEDIAALLPELDLSLDFRLRLTQKNETLLHVDHEIDTDTSNKLKEIVALRGFDAPKVEYMQSLSGYFDRIQA